jgi:arylsulfatase A-like enzyme
VPQSTDDYLNTIPKPAAISVRRKKEQVDLDPDLAKEIKHAYYATTSFVDAQIGRVLDKLKETGLDKNTIVVFTSDHGYHLGEHGHWQKQTLFEDGTRVPLIIAGPGIKINNKINNNPVELVDLYPTIMDLVQMQTPKFVSGKSVVPLLENSENIVRESALTELQINTGNGIAQGYSIKTKRYRLSQWEHKGIKDYELYDHFSDTSELTNLSEYSDYQKIRDSLVKILDIRILNAKKVPLGLGRQITNAKPWLEPKIIRSKPK